MAKHTDKDDAALLRRTPSLKLLRNVVVPRVSANWKTIGLNLDIADCRLSAIENSQHYQTDACCTEMFSIWLNLAPHTGSLPLTWGSVLSAIEKVERVTSEELLAELKGSMESPLFEELTHQAAHKLAGELKAYYNKLDPVVGDNYSPEVEFVELAVVERQRYGFMKKKKMEEFLQATVYGIDEVYQKSYPVQYCQMLTLAKGPTTGKHIIISGAPGSGKTTLVRQLCKDLSSGNLPNDYTLVVLVELRELILFLQDNEEAQLHHLFRKFKRRVDIQQVCKELEESHGRGMLLVLDGFDELDVRLRRCQLLMELLSSESNYLPECDILVTSRPVTCPDLLCLMRPLHRHIEILGFSDNCIASFVQSYFKHSSQPPPTQPPPSQPPPSQPPPSQTSVEGGCEAEKLLGRLDQLPQVKGMCRTPVVLKIVCKVCQLLGADSLPATMTGIYEKFVIRQLLENGPEGAIMSSILHIPSREYPFFSDLCRIAFECCTKQKLMISRQDIGDVLPPLIRGSIYGLLYADPVEDIRAHRELMLYHFMHKTVQEALAACHVAKFPDPKRHMEVWRKWLGCPEMAEVWKFYCGLTRLRHVDVSLIVKQAILNLELTGKEAGLGLELTGKESSMSSQFAGILPILQLHEAGQHLQSLLVISLFEAGNVNLARVELPLCFPREREALLSTPYETAAYTFALQHDVSLERLALVMPRLQGASVNLQPLLDVLSCHPTVRELRIFVTDSIAAKDCQALCQFLSGKHHLRKLVLKETFVEVVVAALSTERSTMEELECHNIHCVEPDLERRSSLTHALKSTSLRHIIISGHVGDLLSPILKGFAANTNTVDRMIKSIGTFPLIPQTMSLLAELRRFLVPCVKCDLSIQLPVGAWGTLLSGVGAARRLEHLRVSMHGKPEEAGPEWDHIDQTTLEEVERSWAHSTCREVVFDISASELPVAMSTSHFNIPLYEACSMQGSTLDATMKLLCAAVRGIIERKGAFVLVIRVDKKVSRLDEFEEIAKGKCAVTVNERTTQILKGFSEEPVSVLELNLVPCVPLHVV